MSWHIVTIFAWPFTLFFGGYPYGQKAYKLLDLDTKRVFTSSDVVFHSNCFPYHQPYQLHSISSPNFVTEPDMSDNVSPLVFPVDTPTQVSHASPSPPSSPTSSSPTIFTSPDPPPVRRSSRPHVKAAYLNDYVCSNAAYTPTGHNNPHWCNLVAFHQLPSCSQAHISQINLHNH